MVRQIDSIVQIQNSQADKVLNRTVELFNVKKKNLLSTLLKDFH